MVYCLNWCCNFTFSDKELLKDFRKRDDFLAAHEFVRLAGPTAAPYAAGVLSILQGDVFHFTLLLNNCTEEWKTNFSAILAAQLMANASNPRYDISMCALPCCLLVACNSGRDMCIETSLSSVDVLVGLFDSWVKRFTLCMKQ